MGKYFSALGQYCCLSGVIFLTACTLSESETPSKKSILVSIEIETPEPIANSRLNLLQIHGLLIIESSTFEKRIPFLFSNNKISPITTNLVEDSYIFSVEFEMHDTPYPSCKNVQLLTTDPIQRTVEQSGSNNVVFARNHPYTPADDDGDLISNLDELDYESSPCDANQTPILRPIRVRHNYLNFGYPTEQGMTISWQPAVHEIKGTLLEYLVVFSPAANIDIVKQVEAAVGNNAVIGTWSTNTSIVVSNMAAAYALYWNVLVRDNEGSFSVYAQSRPNGLGILDISFSDNADGIFTREVIPSKPFGSQGRGIFLNSENIIFATGREFTSSTTSSLAIWRYDIFGNATSTFANGQGLAELPNPLNVLSDDSANAIAIDNLGNILVTGQIGNSNSIHGHNMVLWKIFNSGLPETSFGNLTGYAISDKVKGTDTNLSEVGNALTVDDNGNILVAGYAEVSNIKTVMVVWRYNNKGQLDLSFGNNKGYITHNGLGGNVGKPYSSATSIKVDPNGNIYVTGLTTNVDGNTDLALWKFDDSGATDSRFGNNSGFTTHHSAAGGGLDDSGNAIQIDNANRIVITGISQSSSDSYAMTVWRYQDNGLLDTSFANQGYLTHNLPSGATVPVPVNDRGNSIDIDKHDNIVVTGSHLSYRNFPGSNFDMAIWRFTKDGNLDLSFGPNGGYVTHHNATLSNNQSNDFGNGLIINPEGHYLISGTSHDVNDRSNMTIWQYQ